MSDNQAEMLHRTVVLIRLSLGEIDKYIDQLSDLRGGLQWTLEAIESSAQRGGADNA